MDDAQTKRILNRGFQSLPILVESIHFNENKPENQNVYIPNWRDKNSALIFDGSKWKLQNTKDVIEELKDKGIDFIQRKYNELDKTDRKDQPIIKKIAMFLSCYEDYDKEKISNLNNDIQLVLYNNRNIIEKKKEINN